MKNFKGLASFGNKIPPLDCYKGDIVFTDKPSHSELKLYAGSSFHSLIKEMERDEKVSASGIFKKLSFSASASRYSYAKNTDSEYTAHILISSILTREVKTEFGYGQDALSKMGKSLYQNGENEMFPYLCGDKIAANLIETGSVSILMSVNARQNTHTSTKTKSLAAKLSKESIGSFDYSKFSKDFSSLIDEDVVISIKAYQYGGNPNELGKILKGGTGGDGSYLLECSTGNKKACIQSIEGAIQYIQKDFPEQKIFSANEVTLPIAHGKPLSIKYFGLTINRNLITDELTEISQKDSVATWNSKLENIKKTLFICSIVYNKPKEICDKIQNKFDESLDLYRDYQNCLEDPEKHCRQFTNKFSESKIPNLKYLHDTQNNLLDHRGKNYYIDHKEQVHESRCANSICWRVHKVTYKSIEGSIEGHSKTVFLDGDNFGKSIITPEGNMASFIPRAELYNAPDTHKPVKEHLEFYGNYFIHKDAANLYYLGDVYEYGLDHTKVDEKYDEL